MPADVSVEIGTLGVTRIGRKVVPTPRAGSTVCDAANKVVLHEPGAFGPRLSTTSGHALRPLGRDATPGVRAAAPTDSQLALGPEAGHSMLPAGSVRRGESSTGADTLNACGQP